MAGTATALMLRLFGTSLAASVQNPSKLDLLQVVDEGGKVVWNLTSAGVANTNPATSTGTALLRRYFGSTFSAAFVNPSGLDIFQVIDQGGAVVYHVTSAGLAVTP